MRSDPHPVESSARTADAHPTAPAADRGSRAFAQGGVEVPSEIVSGRKREDGGASAAASGSVQSATRARRFRELLALGARTSAAPATTTVATLPILRPPIAAPAAVRQPVVHPSQPGPLPVTTRPADHMTTSSQPGNSGSKGTTPKDEKAGGD